MVTWRWLSRQVLVFGGMQVVGWIAGGVLMPWTTKGMV